MEKEISLEYYKHLVTACLYSVYVYVNRSTEPFDKLRAVSLPNPLTPKSVVKEKL
jgi:hypothetical protein